MRETLQLTNGSRYANLLLVVAEQSSRIRGISFFRRVKGSIIRERIQVVSTQTGHSRNAVRFRKADVLSAADHPLAIENSEATADYKQPASLYSPLTAEMRPLTSPRQ
jgi:hypothetical protein